MSTTWESSSKTASTTTSSSSSGCSMSPPEESDKSTVHIRSDRYLDYCNAHLSSAHGLNSSFTSTNCDSRVDRPLADPESVATATRMQREMVELDRQLARIRLRCRNLVSTTSGTSTPTTATLTSTDSVSSSSTRAISATDWDLPLTPPRRAIVPRMGTRRSCTNYPFDDPFRDSVGVAQPREVKNTTTATLPDKTSTADSSNSLTADTRRLCFDNNHNTTLPSKDPVKVIRVTQFPELENTTPVTTTIIHDDASTPFHFSSSSTRVAGIKQPSCENTASIIGSMDNILAPNQSNCVLKSLTSAETRRLECERLPINVDNASSNSSSINQQQSPAKEGLVDTTPKTDPVSVRNTSISPRQLKSSTAGRNSDDRKMRKIGDEAQTDRKSVRSYQTVAGSVDRSSQTDEVDADRRRRSQRQELYRRYADVMYTNPDNLEHTIAVQQALFRQQLDGTPVDRQTGDGGAASRRRTDRAMEWVVKRRADGSRYVTRRPVKWPHGWQAERRRTAEERRCRRRTETTTDDGTMEWKSGRYWTKDERRRQVVTLSPS